MNDKLKAVIDEYDRINQKITKLCKNISITGLYDCDDYITRDIESCRKQRLEVERKINAVLSIMQTKQEYLDFDDIINILNISNPDKHTFKSLIFAIEQTNSPISIAVMDYILTYSAAVTKDEDTYKDLLYLMAKTVDTLAGNKQLIKSVTELYVK